MITIDGPRSYKHAVILCHPDRSSFNAAVAQRYARTVMAMGQQVVIRDLYGMRFDPVLKAEERPGCADYEQSDDVAEELATLAGADVFVLVYPIWFGMPPAMLKGYVDRVLGAEFPFRNVRDRVRHPLLSDKRLLSFSSSGTTKQWLDEQGAWLSLRMVFDRYIERAFSLASSEHVHFAAIVEDIEPHIIEDHLHEVEQAAQRMCAALLHRPDPA